jgi:heptosyltransferase-2
MNSPKRILIINPFGIGDVLFTIPVISNLRKAYPDAFIGYLVNRRALPIVASNPKINQVYVYERDEFKKDLASSWIKLFGEIKNAHFDMAFDFSLNSTFGFLCMACGIDQRIGYDYRGRGRFLTDMISLEGYEGKHVVDYYLDLISKLNIPVSAQNLEIVVDSDHQQWAKDWIKQNKIPTQRPIFAVIPGGGASWGKDSSYKRWPIEQYAALVDKIIAKSKATVILMGDKNEQAVCQELTRLCSHPVYSAVGETTLLQMAALLKSCSLALVNDGGPLHVAVAVGIKTVSIFGPVDPVVYGPFPRNGHVVIDRHLACQPCYRQFRKASCEHLSCLRDLSVEEVFHQVERVL